MPTHETATLPDARRRELLDVAGREFARAGYAQASLNAIIRACGMSKSSFYHYVDGKAGLFEAVVGDLRDSVVEHWEPPAPATMRHDFWAEVDAVVSRLAAVSHDGTAFTTLGRLFRLADVPPEAARTLTRVRTDIEAWLTAALAVGREAGAVRDDLPWSLQLRVVLAVLEAMDAWSLEQLTDDGHDITELARLQLDALRRLLGP